MTKKAHSNSAIATQSRSTRGEELACGYPDVGVSGHFPACAPLIPLAASLTSLTKPSILYPDLTYAIPDTDPGS